MDLPLIVVGCAIDRAIADDVIPLCELAKNLEEAGEFDRAAETLNSFWQGVPNRPVTQGLGDEAKAELLLRTGTLTGWLGSAKQIPGAQEIAKDLISESAATFEYLGIADKVADLQARAP